MTHIGKLHRHSQPSSLGSQNLTYFPKLQQKQQPKIYLISPVMGTTIAEAILHEENSRSYLFKRAVANAGLFRKNLYDARDELRKELQRCGSIVGLAPFLDSEFGAIPITVSSIIEVLRIKK